MSKLSSTLTALTLFLFLFPSSPSLAFFNETAASRFERSLIRLSTQGLAQELADYIYYNAPGSGLAGDSFYQVVQHLRANNPEAIPVIRLGIEQATMRDGTNQRALLGRQDFPIQIIFDLAEEQVKLERILCVSGIPVVTKQQIPDYVDVAVETAGLRIENTETVQYPSLVLEQVAQAKYWALKRCAAKIQEATPTHAESLLALADALFGPAKPVATSRITLLGQNK